MKKEFAAFTLTEIMVVLVIVGILVLLALPNLQGLFGEAYAVEAKTNLKYLYERQQNYRNLEFRYSDDLNALKFETQKTKEQGGNAVYVYEVMNADKVGFIAQAKAVEDFDGDGVFNIWQIDQDGNLQEIVAD
ncbi:MAG: prepilin-type N-terminal cleavage/methylation domain-containing protein [Bacteroidota bacterium]